MSEAASSQQWWYVLEGRTLGPAGSDEIRSMVERGVLLPTSHVIPVGAAEWSTVAEQRAALGVAPAPQPPSPPSPPAFPPPAGPVAAAPPASLAGVALASPGKRLGAWLLDCVLAVITLFIGWLVWSVVIWERGQTPGKSLLGLRCARSDTGRVATRGTMALRELVGKALLGSATFGITTIVSAFMILGEARQGIWDKIANTTVVDDPDGRLLA